MARLFLDRIDAHGADIGRLDARIEEAMAPFRLARELLTSIPGFSTKTAEVFIAETGGDMGVFPSAGHLASWAGVSPGSNESAGRIKSTRTRLGNPYLKGALGVSAMSAARSKNTFFSAKYQRIRSRRGPMRALVAVEHALVITAWNMLTDGGSTVNSGPTTTPCANRRRPKLVRSVSSKRSAIPSRSNHSPTPHSQQPAVDQWSPARGHQIFVSVHTPGADLDERVAEVVG
jgi:hypothetical protein